MSDQLSFEFEHCYGRVDPIDVWRRERARAVEAICLRVGAPIGRCVEVQLKEGPVLRGVLRVADEELWVNGERKSLLLQIGRATFGLGEIESVVRVDEEDLQYA